MAYRLKRGERVPEGIVRVVLEELDSAADQLEHPSVSKRAEAIHEARKSLKKIRGVLRLVQGELGSAYKAENARFRNLGRKLSDIRDAAAIIETFDNLVKKYREEVPVDSFAAIRRALERAKRETEQTADVQRVIAHTRAALRASAGRIKKWPLRRDGFKAIAPGLAKTYRRGRKAMRDAQRDGTPAKYHEFRKRVKDHWYHVRLLENLWTTAMQAREASLKELETWLGDDHNLVVLSDRVHNDPEAYGSDKEIDLFVTLAEKEQKELRQNALSLGERLYEEKPRAFVQRMSKLWDAWQDQPDTMKDIEKAERKAPATESAPPPPRTRKREVA